MCLHIAKMKMATVKVGGITQNIDLGYACFRRSIIVLCIARAAVNESICEDSHALRLELS